MHLLSKLLLLTALFTNQPQTTDAIPLPVPRTIASEIELVANKVGVNPFVLKAVTCAESKWNTDAINKNIDKNGNVWSKDISFGQINDYYHADTMAKMGLDINNGEDNLIYTALLMKKEGTDPWNSSKYKWQKYLDSGDIPCTNYALLDS